MRLSPGLLLVLLIAGCCCPPRPACCPEPAPVKRSEALAREMPQPVSVPVDDDGADGPSAAIRKVLASKRVKGLDWEEQNLDQVLSYLRTITGLNFYLTLKAREERFDDVQISVQLDDVSVQDVLDLVVTEPFELTWEPRGGVIWILTAAEVDEVSGSMRLRYFDVNDLIGKSSGQWTSGSELVQELQRTVQPDYWGRENAVIESRNHILIVRASDPIQKALEDYLAAARNRLATSPVLAPAAK